jgi:phage terminase large subunit
MEIEIDRKVFNTVYLPQLQNMARVQITYGGAASGKSKFKAQQAVIDIMSDDRNWLVVRQVGRTIRGSVAQEIQRVIIEWGLSALFNINKTDGTITCIKTGSQIIFSGLDDVEKLKSITPAKGAITDIWVEEATETNERDVIQLMKRQRGGSEKTAKRIHLTFNPILRDHWIYKKWFENVAWGDDQTEYNSAELSILKTWYIHNRFLTKQDIDGLLNERDEYFRSVYTFGNWGVLGNVIFKNWEVRDLTAEMAQMTNHRNGLDFGFASDPAALVCTHYDKAHKTIYVYDELYQRGMTNDVLAVAVKGIISAQPVTADSSEPKSIAELQMYGVSVHAANKGKDSVVHGIQWLQQQRIIVHSECVNMRNELQQYKWKEKDGAAIMQPVDKHNHLIDALRYAYEGDMQVTWYML